MLESFQQSWGQCQQRAESTIKLSVNSVEFIICSQEKISTEAHNAIKSVNEEQNARHAKSQ